jgi:hypothetical protein
MSRCFKAGMLLTQKELNLIADNYILSQHAQQRYQQRMYNVNLQKSIKHCLLAYYNTDGTVNIAFDRFTYLVVNPKTFKVITIKEKSLNDIDIFTKRDMAIQGKHRRVM